MKLDASRTRRCEDGFVSDATITTIADGATPVTSPFPRFSSLRRCHPNASDRAFVFLGGPDQAVRLQGPTFDWPAGRCLGQKLTITQPMPPEPTGVEATITGIPGLTIEVMSSGLTSHSLTLVQVTLFERRGMMESEFVIAGLGSVNGDGEIFSKATVDGATVGFGKSFYVESKWR